jgi:Ca-activated chloride channel family protein
MTFENQNDEMEARLSAYAFGELEGEKLAAMEAAVAADPSLALRVAELRAFGNELGAALAEEPAPAASDSSAVPTKPAAPRAPAERGRLLRFPAWLWSTAGIAAAAGLAVMVAIHETALSLPDEPRQAKRFDETITPLPSTPTTPPAGSVPTQTSPDFVFRAAEPIQVKEGDLLSLSPSVTPPGASAPLSFRDSYALPPPPTASAPTPPVQITAGTPQALIPAPARLDTVAAEVRRRRQVLGEVHLTTKLVSAEHYVGVREARFVAVEAEPLSTFSIDVDTASYSNVRRFLQNGQLPPHDAVRVEELINYFPYRYAPPPAVTARAADAPPFAAHLAVASAPWEPRHRLVRVALKGREFSAEARPPANLVFLVDVSGSMSPANRLPLVKSSLRQLLGQLRADDRVAIVTYAGASGLALPSTPVERSDEILASLGRLESGGSTNGGMGIHLAYDIAKANFVPGGVNRVILCTDGDFNVGVTGREELLSLIQEKARSRVFLTVLGFGMGNLKDGTLEMLANKGNGAYAYIDTEREARKVFVEQAQGTLATIAKDVKIQVEFNPARVASYRLIGYENRALAKEDFNNDRVDAGEIGAGHTVTALYEIVPVGADEAAPHDEEAPRPAVDPLRYGRRPAPAPSRPAAATPPPADASAELLTVKIRYKQPEGDVSRKLEFPLVDRGASFRSADADFRFAAAVAAWGMLLRDSPHSGTATLADVLRWAEDGLAHDPQGHRAEFVELVRRSAELRGE